MIFGAASKPLRGMFYAYVSHLGSTLNARPIHRGAFFFRNNLNCELGVASVAKATDLKADSSGSLWVQKKT
ncbi:MAG: hypothetical protein CFH35_00410 [Alphaproteobacteria bacterium MarineAlpha9_Bin5]|nr:MAG: hypothetical protein CFH35_00410 [Alphaproteobacteria bacterium MarineAlpha9_Bin5]